MDSYDFKTLLGEHRITCHGALDYDIRPDGISPRRLASWTRPQVPRLMDVIVRMPSGVRLIFETDATEVRITALATNLVTPPAVKRPVVMDLVTGGQTYSATSMEGNTLLLNMENPDSVELVRGVADEWKFSRLPAGKKRCEVWLPHNALIELHKLSLTSGASLDNSKPGNQRRWIHYGSSISHCLEAEQPTLTWPAVAASQLDWQLQSLGFGGQCHLDPFVARTMADSDAEVLSIKVGINIINGDSMRERMFLPLLHGFLDTIRDKKPDAPIVLISPIYCPPAEQHPGPTVPVDGKFVVIEGHKAIRNGSLTLERVRALMVELVRQREDNNLYYLDGKELFGEDDQHDLPDDLHPNPEGYIRMGQRFSQLIPALLESSRTQQAS